MRYTVAGLRRRRRRAAAIIAGAFVAAAAGGVAIAFAVAPITADAVSDWRPEHRGGQPGADEHTIGTGDAALTEEDGMLPEGVSIFANGYPGIDNLDAELLAALRQASADAGIDFTVTSGWRTAAYQQSLLADAVANYGSEEEAARWAASPETSSHVSGDAVDLGPYAALDWLAQFGDAYALCQTYANEAWHFELRAEAPAQGCPEMYPDPSYDPRLD